MSHEYWEIDYRQPPADRRYDPIADHGRERPGYRVRWIAGTTDYEWVPVERDEPLYRVIWGRGPISTLPMLWPGVLAFVRIARKVRPGWPIEVVRVERVAPNA